MKVELDLTREEMDWVYSLVYTDVKYRRKKPFAEMPDYDLQLEVSRKFEEAFKIADPLKRT